MCSFKVCYIISKWKAFFSPLLDSFDFPILCMIASLSVQIQISKGILFFSKNIQVVFRFVF